MREGDGPFFLHLVRTYADAASDQDPRVFPLLCGIVGLGRLIGEGEREQLGRLRAFGGDARWRVREAVAMALQAWGDRDPAALLEEMQGWAAGSWLEQRAAVAALCEPRLLSEEVAPRVVELLDAVTERMAAGAVESDRRMLRQALGYGWSVAIVACPEEGRACFERWAGRADEPDVRRVVAENLKKKRLTRLDAAWVERMKETVAGAGPAARDAGA